MKILNLFAGIGGNRELWNGHKITAVEHDPKIAYLYHQRFPEDNIIVDNAYEYLLHNFEKFDIIWASPPCQSHTILVRSNMARIYKGVKLKRRFPDLRLYSIILFLKHNFRGNWIVENVFPYYDYLIPPTCTRGRHAYWSNLNIPSRKKQNMRTIHKTSGWFLSKDQLEFYLKERNLDKEFFKHIPKIDVAIILSNMVDPQEGKTLLDYLIGKKVQQTLV